MDLQKPDRHSTSFFELNNHITYIHAPSPPPSPTHCYCECFFCPAGPISLSNAAYETCRLESPRTATKSILSSKIDTNRPMKMPGPKNWYFSNKGALLPFSAGGLSSEAARWWWWLEKSRLSSRWDGNWKVVSIW